MQEVTEQKKTKEEYAVVLDFLPHGYPFDTTPSHRKSPVMQAIGKEHFVLLELVPKKDVFLQPYDEIYIGEGKRDKVHHIVGKLPSEKLTPAAKSSLEFVVSDLVTKNEQRFVKFFNDARPMTMRMHTLELIPGLGKKHMWEILERRQEQPFTSFEDMKNRVKLMPDPKKAIVRRILAEIVGAEKHHLFVDV